MITNISADNNISIEDVKGGFAIQDQVITENLSLFLQNADWHSFLKNDGKLDNLHNSYKHNFKSWIQSSKLNNIRGLDNFPHITITNGTSEAFSMFMMRHCNRHFKFFIGDFIMHKVSSNIMNADWSWFTMCSELKHYDAVIISCPFSNTGCKHEEMEAILSTCNRLNIPVLIDLAYFGTTSNLDITLNYNCVEEVTFSLGKTFPIIGARAGIRFQKTEIDDAINFANQSGIVNNFACLLGNHALSEFSPDYIWKKYASIAEKIADMLSAGTTQSAIFLTSTDEKWSTLRRAPENDERARLCISNILLQEYNKLMGI